MARNPIIRCCQECGDKLSIYNNTRECPHHGREHESQDEIFCMLNKDCEKLPVLESKMIGTRISLGFIEVQNEYCGDMSWWH